MQNAQEILSSVRLGGDNSGGRANNNSNNNEKTDLNSSDAIVKKLRLQHQQQPPQEIIEYRVPRVTSSSTNGPPSYTIPINQNTADRTLPTSIVADKYQLFEQVEGSSLYRCVDINTQEQLVCKVSFRTPFLLN